MIPNAQPDITERDAIPGIRDRYAILTGHGEQEWLRIHERADAFGDVDLVVDVDEMR